MTTARPVSTMDRIVGKIQRAVGELTGRPDLVIEGEARPGTMRWKMRRTAAGAH